MHNKTRIVLPLTLIGAAAAASAQPTVTFTFLPEGCVGANDMTPDGRYIVGGWDSDGDGLADGGYRYDTATEQLDILSEGDGSVPAAVSNDGLTLVGSIGEQLGETAAVWTLSTGWDSIGYLPNALECPSRSNGYEISADGSTVVGLSWDECSGRGFVWTPGAGMLELEPLANGGNRASVVSADGSVAAGFAQGQFSRTPAYWDTVTRAGTLIDPTGQNQGEVMGISDDGSTMLLTYYDYAHPTKDGYYDAYTWSEAGGLHLVGDGSVTGGWGGNAMDIAEERGTVVGFDILLGNRRAWIQPDGQGPCVELGSFISSHGGTPPAGVTLEVVQAISNDGTRLIGHGFYPNAWMVTLDFGCDVDINGDGIADNGDIGAFVALFLAQDLGADFNGDGIVDNGDIGTFVAAFLAGC